MAWSSCVCLILTLGPQLCTSTPSSKHPAVIRCGLLVGYMNGRMLTVCCRGQSDLCSGLHIDGFIEYFGEIVPLCLCVLLLLHQGLLCSPGDIWHCLETFLIVTTGVGSHRHLMGGGCQTPHMRRTAQQQRVTLRPSRPTAPGCQKSWCIYTEQTYMFSANSLRARASWMDCSLVQPTAWMAPRSQKAQGH